MIKQYCRKVKGKTLQIVGQFLQYSFFSNSFFIFSILTLQDPRLSAGEIKYKALRRYDVHYEPAQVNKYVCSESKYISCIHLSKYVLH